MHCNLGHALLKFGSERSLWMGDWMGDFDGLNLQNGPANWRNLENFLISSAFFAFVSFLWRSTKVEQLQQCWLGSFEALL